MYDLPESWVKRWQVDKTFDHLFAVEGPVYRNKDGRKTLRFSVDGKGYFAKFYRGIGWKVLLRHLLRFKLPVLTANRELEAIRQLERLGVQTMRVVGYGRRGINPARLQSFIITQELTDTLSLEDFCRPWNESPPPAGLYMISLITTGPIAGPEFRKPSVFEVMGTKL